MKKLNGIKVKEILVRFVNDEELDFGMDYDDKIEVLLKVDSISNKGIEFKDLCNVCLELAEVMGFDYGGDVEIIESVLYELGLEEDEVLELVDGYVNN
jgi:hypothetical protein